MTEQPTSLIPFSFDGAEVRAVLINGEPHFIGKDVCDRLAYANATDAMKRHCRGVAKHYPIVDSLGRKQEARALTEPDVLRLIMGSKLPTAERFEAWVFEEVLPAIRKQGGYMIASPDESPEELALRAMKVLQATIDRQKAQLAEAVPKALALDKITAAEGRLSFQEAAKSMAIRPKRLMDYLKQNKWIYRRAGSSNWVAYQARIEAGLLEHNVITIPLADGSEKVVTHAYVTPKGLIRLTERLVKSEQIRAAQPAQAQEHLSV